MATKQDLTDTHRGDTIVLIITVTGEDVTDDEFWFTMKACLDDADPGALQHHATAPAGAPATAGQYTMTVPETLTKLLTPGKYFYDVQWVDPTPSPSLVNTLVYGVIEILTDVSVDIV
jgi:hypothetical protein